MEKLRNLITAILLGSAVFAAGFSVESAEKNVEKVFYAEEGKHDKEFWDKFRDSVMPDKNKNNGEQNQPRERHEEPQKR